jgi:hypothetical protein
MVHLVEGGGEEFSQKEKKSPKFVTPFLVNAALSVGQGPRIFSSLKKKRKFSFKTFLVFPLHSNELGII